VNLAPGSTPHALRAHTHAVASPLPAVSHCWGARFADLMSAVTSLCADDVFVWFECCRRAPTPALWLAAARTDAACVLAAACAAASLPSTST
jgi:hypothetical protein